MVVSWLTSKVQKRVFDSIYRLCGPSAAPSLTSRKNAGGAASYCLVVPLCDSLNRSSCVCCVQAVRSNPRATNAQTPVPECKTSADSYRNVPPHRLPFFFAGKNPHLAVDPPDGDLVMTLKRKRVLLAEDSVFVRDLFVHDLTSLGFECEERCLSAGMDGLATKPLTLKELQKVVSRFL